jgi:hypothetical protein
MARETIVGYEMITVSTGAVGLTAALLAQSTRVELYVEGPSVRYRLDGVNPTASVGIPVYEFEELGFPTDYANSLKMIRSGSADVNVHVTYYWG